MSTQSFEYKVVPAPRRGEKARSAKTTEDRFAYAVQSLMNGLASEGWEYVRADTLPCDERSGLTGTKTSFQNLLVFRRAVAADDDMPAFVAADRAAPGRAVDPIPRLGAAEAPAGAAPSLGPALGELAALSLDRSRP
ncbi:MAG: DUF4177 domain-containing protein [Pseudomonadota bacterium]